MLTSVQRTRAASIRDVARLAGVSHQTVSRVLNGHPSVREDTRTRVLVAMGELQFRPSRAARMLSTQRSETIGILAAAVGSHYGPASSVSAVEDAARGRGFYATVAHLASVSPDAITAAVEELLRQDVEGIVIVAPRTAVLSHLASLPLDVPIVAAQGEQRDAGGIPVVSVDQQAGVRLVMRHLMARGHERILHLAGPPDWNDAQSRRRAYEAEMAAAGLAALDPVFGDWTSESGYRVGRTLVARKGRSGRLPAPDASRAGDGRLPFTAVFSSNDQMALGLIHAFREAGLDVPRDVSVAGFDDIPESAHFWPPLTTVRQDFASIGDRCVATLVAAIDQSVRLAARVSAQPATGSRDVPSAGEAPPQAVTPRLVIRDSVAPVLPARERPSWPESPAGECPLSARRRGTALPARDDGPFCRSCRAPRAGWRRGGNTGDISCLHARHVISPIKRDLPLTETLPPTTRTFGQLWLRDQSFVDRVKREAGP
jgi:DNA-binding LacI/PurR family transcriptional regulator